jgi:uncharacterized protein
MLFRRRQPETFGQKLRGALWPRRSWRRSARYMQRRVLRLRATPHAIAAGIATGVFSTFTPFIGFHFIIAFALAWLIRGSLAGAALGCLLGNPVTFPLIWASTYELGRYVLAAETPDGHAPASLGPALMRGDLSAVWTPYLKPMLVGSVPLGLGFALLTYFVVLTMARSFQETRLRRTAAERALAAARAAQPTLGGPLP